MTTHSKWYLIFATWKLLALFVDYDETDGSIQAKIECLSDAHLTLSQINSHNYTTDTRDGCVLIGL